MEPEAPWPGPDYDPLDISHLSVVHQRHIIGLGLIADLTAQLEATVRWMLGFALEIDAVEELDRRFLGKRVNTLARQLSAEAKRRDDALLGRCAAWARKAENATSRRDALIHRPVFQEQLQPARPAQVPEQLNAQSISLVQEMNNLLDEVLELTTEVFMRRRLRQDSRPGSGGI